MNYDTLTLAGVEKDFASWGFGLHSIKGRKKVRNCDTFDATIVNTTVANESDSPTFPFEGKVIVRVNRSGPGGAGTYSGGTVKFVGKRVDQKAKTDANGQGVSYTFKGPWYDLENSDYLQVYKGSAGSYYLPELVMFTGNQILNVNGTTYAWLPISVGDQIQAILQFVLDQYAAQGMAAPFQYKGRALNSGAIDLTTSSGTVSGSPGGNYNFYGQPFNYALQSGMSIDSSLYSLFLPSLIEKPMKASQAIQKCLEMSPRINVWFDYTAVDGSSNPLPMIRFDLVNSMTAVSLPLFTGPKYDGTISHKSLNIVPRYDLQLRAAIVKYRITNTVSGNKVVDYAVDKWSGNGTVGALPGASNVNLSGGGNNATDPNAGLRVFNDLIDLQGYSTTIMKGHLDLEPLMLRSAQTGYTNGTVNDHAAKRSWWSSRRGGELAKLEDTRVRFQDKTGAQTFIPDAKLYYASNGTDSTGATVVAGQEFTSADYGFYQYRVVRGTYQTWMAQSAGVLTVKCKAVAAMTFAEYDSTSVATVKDTDRLGNKTKHFLSGEQHVNLELTNAIPDGGSGTSGYANFSIPASSTPGEAYIIGSGGIAQYLYVHLNTLQFDGDYASVAANFVDSGSSQYVTLGNKLNLTNGATLWTTMNAQIQEITEDYGNHETSVQIGVSKILSAGNLSQLLNMWRFRRTWYNPAIRTDNTVIGGGAVDMAKSASGANTVTGLDMQQQQTLIDYSTMPSGTSPGVPTSKVTLDPTRATTNSNLN